MATYLETMIEKSIFPLHCPDCKKEVSDTNLKECLTEEMH